MIRTIYLLEWLKQNTDNTKCMQGFRASGTLICWWWDCKMVQPLWNKLVEGHLGCFLVFSIVKKAAVTIHAHIFV